jgi:hypothetical protein
MTGTTATKTTPNANTGNAFPWAGQPDETACNYAFGLLLRNLPARVMIENKLHTPTLMTAIGAVAGVAAQVSLLADAAKMQKVTDEKKLLEVKLKDGRTMMYGDALNEMLYSARDPLLAPSRVWNMMVSAALSKGLDRSALPNVPDMFKHVSESFGTEKEGRPSTPDNAQPIASVRDLLRVVGPVSFAALAGEMQPTGQIGGEPLRASRLSWVAITAQAAGHLLATSAKVMPPALCLTVAMEAAIYASKLRVNAPESEEVVAIKPQA